MRPFQIQQQTPETKEIKITSFQFRMYIMYRLTTRMFVAFLLYLCQTESLFKDILNAYKIVAEEQTKDSLNFLSSLFEFLYDTIQLSFNSFSFSFLY
jgi:hypothetical protein